MIDLTNSNKEEKDSWKNSLGLKKNEILHRLSRIRDVTGTWCSLNMPIAKKIAAIREKLDIPLSKCPCDPMSEDRGCIGSLCLKEIIEQGVCHCHCFERTWLNRQELEALFKFYNKDIEAFDKWFAGQTGGILRDGQGNYIFCYYPWDVEIYLRSSFGISIASDNLASFARKKLLEYKVAPKANGTQDNSELPLNP